MNEQMESGIKKMSPGKSFFTFCVVRNKEVKYKQNGEPYLLLELGDASGRLKARIWDKIQEYSAKTPIGGIVKIQATVQVYNNRKELKIQKIRSATQDDGVLLETLLPKSSKDVNELKKTFAEHYKSIKNEYLSAVLDAIFQDKRLAEAYYMSPGGKLWHHNYLFGMMEHVVKLLNMSNLMKSHYPAINVDLLKTGIICHDLGKVYEYSLNGFIDFSTEGRLIGNIATGYGILVEKINGIKNFPKKLRLELLHIILSHQGKEHHAPVVPMTLEAIVLKHLIQLDAHTNALIRICENDAVPHSEWTKYIPLLDRFIYVGENDSFNNNPED